MNKVDLSEVFESLNEVDYVLVKPSGILPDYQLGSDLDIFCLDIELATNKILSCLNGYINSPILRVDVTENIGQRYIDLMDGEAINIRFDLYSKLPKYTKVLIKESYFSSVVENSKLVNIGNDKPITISVPGDLDDCVLRYIEYQEWYAERPDKIKHIEYILSSLSTDTIDKGLRKLHYYIDFPKWTKPNVTLINRFTESIAYKFEQLGRLRKYVINNGIKKTIKKSLQVLRNSHD